MGLRRSAKAVSIVVLSVVSLYAAAVLVLGVLPLNRRFEDAEHGVDVYLRSNGAHADLVVPIDAAEVNWAARLPMDALNLGGSGRADLSFGWGDRDFYLSVPTWADVRVGPAILALTGLDSTVLHVEAIAVPRPTELTRHVMLTAEAYRRLAAFIEESFRLDAQGAKIVIPNARYGSHDAFFEARGHYSIFLTCNEWTRRGLARARVRVPVWSPFDKALLFQLPSSTH